MKKKLTKFLALGGIGLLMLSACKKDGALVTSNGGKPGTLTASVATLPLDKTKISDPTMVINFSFTAPNFGYSAAVTNTLQIDVPGDNWKNPTSATLGVKANSQGYSTADFNNLVLKLNVPAGVATPIQVRVMHSISASVAPVYSNTVSLTVTAFNLTSFVYVPGSYEGWNNPGAQEDSLVSVTGNGVYVGIINFPAGDPDFLIVPVKGSWAYKYATTANATSSATTATYSTELVSSGGNNFYAPSTPGYYLVTLNTNTNQLTMVPSDYYSLIGADFTTNSALQWNVDFFMKYINDGSGTWVATQNFSNPGGGGFKIRMDANWGTSWGTSSTAGILTDASGGNINVTAAGNYTVSVVLPATAAGSGAPPTTVAYTVK